MKYSHFCKVNLLVHLLQIGKSSHDSFGNAVQARRLAYRARHPSDEMKTQLFDDVAGGDGMDEALAAWSLVGEGVEETAPLPTAATSGQKPQSLAAVGQQAQASAAEEENDFIRPFLELNNQAKLFE